MDYYEDAVEGWDMEKLLRATDAINDILKTLNLKQLLFSLFVVLGFVVVPRIGFLNFLLPFDDVESILIFIFSILLVFFFIELIKKIKTETVKAYKKIKNTKQALTRLQDEINDLPIEQKEILVEFLKNGNSSKTLEERESHYELYVKKYLYSLPDTYRHVIYSLPVHRSVAYCDYKINSHYYPQICKLYKSKKILLEYK